MNIIEAKVLEATPCELAQAFCNMGSDEQAQFFAECESVSLAWRAQREKEGKQGLFLGAWWQWQEVGEECLRRGMDSPASRVVATIAGPLYAHALRYMRTPGAHRIEEVNG